MTQGANVTITVTVAGIGATPTGTVILKSGAETLATLTLSGGKASLVASSAPYAPAKYPLTASYGGNGNYSSSVSNTVDITVAAKGVTNTSLYATPDPVIPPGSMSLYASVTSSGTAPTGQVVFYLGSQSLGAATLSHGVAILTSSSSELPAGGYELTAKYDGDANNNGSTSSVFNETVNRSSAGSHPPGKTQYVRNDSLNYVGDGVFFWPNVAAFDKTDERFFLAGMGSSRVDAYDAKSETALASIPVSGAFAIDIGPGDSALWVGTDIGNLYELNPHTFAIEHIFHSQNIGPSGYLASEIGVLANGDLALLAAGFGGDGSAGFAIWNPTTNALKTYLTASDPSGQVNIGPFVVSGDRTKVLAGSADSDGTVYVYDSSTEQITSVNSGSEFIRSIIPSPDGTVMFVVGNLGVVNSINLATLHAIGQVTIPNASDGGPGCVSLDGKTLFIGDPSGESGALNAFNASDLEWKGNVPSLSISDFLDNMLPMAVSDGNVLFGPIGHGAAFTDGTRYQTTNFQNQFNLSQPQPFEGSPQGGTSISGEFLISGLYTGSTPTALYIGANKATSVTTDIHSYDAITPVASVAGVADLMLIQNDGNQNLVPEAYSYGPQMVSTTNAATTDGGGLITIYGYGFGSQLGDASVTIGDSSAKVVNFILQATPYSPYPFYNMSALQVTAPPGTAGMEDLVIKTSLGSWTSSKAITYVPGARLYPLTGGSLNQGVYDQVRQVYYFTNKSEIEVLSPTKGWETPIILPHTNSKTQLWGIGISPNSQVLAVGDIGNSLIYGIDLATSPKEMASVTPVGTASQDKGQPQAPTGLTPTDSGVVYYLSLGIYALHSVNLLTGANHGYTQTFGNAENKYDRLEQSPDGSHIFANYDGSLGIIDVASNGLSFPSGLQIQQRQVEMSLSEDGHTLFSSDIFADISGNPTAEVAYVDYNTWAVASVYGQKLSSDGTLMFQPLTGGLDVIDSATGLLKARLATPFAMANVYDALAVGGTGQDQVVAITGTGNGVAVMDLSSLNSGSLEPELGQRPRSNAISTPAMSTERPVPQSGGKRAIHHRMLPFHADKVQVAKKYLLSPADIVDEKR